MSGSNEANQTKIEKYDDLAITPPTTRIGSVTLHHRQLLWLAILLISSCSNAESIFHHGSLPLAGGPTFNGLSTSSLFGHDPTAATVTTAERSWSTGRARVVVDAIEEENDVLLDLLLEPRAERRGRPFSEDSSGGIAFLRGKEERKSHSDLQLAWSMPSAVATDESHVDWLGERARRHYSTNASPPATTQQHHHAPRYTSTGTTIVGVAGPDWCVLAADSRATAGTMVADKNCCKLHPLASNCAAAGAGTSADLDHITRECCYAARLMQQSVEHGNSDNNNYNYNDDIGGSSSSSSAAQLIQTPPVSVLHLCHYLLDRLYRQGGACQANLIVGGVYQGQGVLRAIHPHGSMDVVSYTALGSGGLAAMGVLESSHHSRSSSSNQTGGVAAASWTLDEAIALAVEAVKAGIDHDMGSGSHVDVCVIGPDGRAQYHRCVLDEDALPGLAERSENTDRSSTQSQQQQHGSLVVEAHGVNGFGNIPYVIQSRRTVEKSREDQERRQQTRWDSILGT